MGWMATYKNDMNFKKIKGQENNLYYQTSEKQFCIKKKYYSNISIDQYL